VRENRQVKAGLETVLLATGLAVNFRILMRIGSIENFLAAAHIRVAFRLLKTILVGVLCDVVSGAEYQIKLPPDSKAGVYTITAYRLGGELAVGRVVVH